MHLHLPPCHLKLKTEHWKLLHTKKYLTKLSKSQVNSAVIRASILYKKPSFDFENTLLCLGTCDTFKTKRLTFHNQSSRSWIFFLQSLWTIVLQISSMPLSLVALKLTSDFSGNRSIAKDAGKMVDSLYRSRNYITPPAMLYLYKIWFSVSDQMWNISTTFMLDAGAA